jgi:hypothetical protein
MDAEALVGARQEAHLRAIDSAYFERFNDLRAASGQDVSQPHLIADSYKQYFAFRHALLHRKAQAVAEEHRSKGEYPQHNRFLLPSSGDLLAPPSQSAVTVPVPSAPEQRCSFPAWRRALLGLRFEQRRGTLEQDMIRRLAAEAMQRAISAEAAAREEFEGWGSEGAGAGGGSGADAADVQAVVSSTWRVGSRLDGGEAVSDPAVAAAMVTLGLLPVKGEGGASTDYERRFGSASTGGTTPLSAHPGMAASLFGDVARATLGAATVTAVAFLAPIRGAEGEEDDTFALGTDSGRVYLGSARTGLLWAVLEGHTGSVTALDWTRSDGQIFLVSTALDKCLRLWFVSLPMFSLPPPPPPAESTARTARVGASTSAKGGAGREAEREAARAAMEAEASAVREAALRAAGPVALGGSADCVQVIPTDYPLTHVLFSPLTPGLVVAAAVEESDFNDWMAVREAAAAAGEGGRRAEEGLPQEDVPPVQEGEDALNTSTGYKGFGEGAAGTSSEQAQAAGHKREGNAWTRVRLHVAKGLATTVSGGLAAAKQTGAAVNYLTAIAHNLPNAVATGTIGGGRSRPSPRVEPRGYVMIFDAVGGRLVHSRRVQGSQVTGPALTRPVSFVTALTWAADGSALYVADGRGLIHSYECELEEARMAVRPLREHSVIYGEGALVGGGMLGLGLERGMGKGVQGLGKLGELMMGGGEGLGLEGGVSDAHDWERDTAPPFLLSLHYRRDLALGGAPVLVGLDSSARVRAFTVPAAAALGVDLTALESGLGGEDVGRAALAAMAAGVQAGVALAKTTVAVGTLGAVQVATNPQAKELAGFVQYSTQTGSGGYGGKEVPPSPALSFAGGMGLAGIVGAGGVGAAVGAGPGLDAIFGMHLGLGRSASAPSIGCHTALSPFPAGDLLLTATQGGALFLLAPHGLPQGVERGGRAREEGAAGSGVTAAQVVSRLVGHTAPVCALAPSPSGRYILSADVGGRVLVWARG